MGVLGVGVEVHIGVDGGGGEGTDEGELHHFMALQGPSDPRTAHHHHPTFLRDSMIHLLAMTIHNTMDRGDHRHHTVDLP